MRQTPLYDRHVAHGGRIFDFHGWALPVQFKGIIDEHQHTRSAVSIFDCSHMGEFHIRGAEACRGLNYLISTDLGGLKVGRARYGAMLSPRANIVDDVISMRLGEDHIYLVCNAATLPVVAAYLDVHVPGNDNVSSQTAKIDVQGPQAAGAMAAVGLDAALQLKYFQVTETAWNGVHCIVSRTGYTGELGWEVFLPPKAAPALWDALLQCEGVEPAGLGARDTLRTEMGYPLSGQDFDFQHSPLESGQESFVHWDHDFLARDVLEAQRADNTHRHLIGIRTGSRRSPRHGFVVHDGDRQVGIVTSGTFGPSVGEGIGLARVNPDVAVNGKALTVGPRRIPVESCGPPFYTGGSCRMKLE